MMCAGLHIFTLASAAQRRQGLVLQHDSVRALRTRGEIPAPLPGSTPPHPLFPCFPQCVYFQEGPATITAVPKLAVVLTCV